MSGCHRDDLLVSLQLQSELQLVFGKVKSKIFHNPLIEVNSINSYDV